MRLKLGWNSWLLKISALDLLFWRTKIRRHLLSSTRFPLVGWTAILSVLSLPPVWMIPLSTGQDHVPPQEKWWEEISHGREASLKHFSLPPSGTKTCQQHRAGSCICHQSHCLARLPTPHCPHACAFVFPGLSLAGLHPAPTWPPHTVQRPQEQQTRIRGNRTALLSELPRLQMGLAGGTPPGPRFAAWDLQNNSADLVVKLVIQTLWIPVLLGFNPCPFCFTAAFALLPFPHEVPPPSSGLLTPVWELPFQEPRNNSAPDSNPSGQPKLPGWQFLAFQLLHFPVLTPGISWQLEEAAASWPPALYSTLLSSHHLPHTTAHAGFYFVVFGFFCPVDHKSLEKLFGETTRFYSSCLPSPWISGSLTLWVPAM